MVIILVIVGTAACLVGAILMFDLFSVTARLMAARRKNAAGGLFKIDIPPTIRAGRLIGLQLVAIGVVAVAGGLRTLQSIGALGAVLNILIVAGLALAVLVLLLQSTILAAWRRGGS